MPCECCGQRLPGEPTKAELAKEANRVARIHRYHTDYALAMGLRAEGVPEKEVAKIRGLYAGNGLWGRQRLRGLIGTGKHYAPGMVQRWGRNIMITSAEES